MRKTLATLVVLCFAVAVFAGDRKDRQKVSVADMTKAIDGTEVSLEKKQPRPQVASPNAMGPGVLLMDSGYDYSGNGNMQQNIINYGDGTFAVARMASSDPVGVSDRASWFAYFDGTSWSPMTKVEAASRGWTDTDVMPDGRQVIISHVGNELNVDVLPGLGIWTSSITGYIAGATDHIWPKLAVDGAGNVHVVSTIRAAISGARFGTYYPVYSLSTDEGGSWNHRFIFGDPFTDLDTTDGKWQGFSIDNYPIEAWGNKVATMVVPRNTPGIVHDVMLAESEDNGANWNVRSIMSWPPLPAAGVDEYRPSQGVDLAYDNNGNVHIVTANYLINLDSAGTGADVFHSQTAPMRHWSEATGWTDMLTFQDIPGYNPAEDIFSGDAVNSAGAGNNTLLKSPSIGFDADNNMYVTFNTPSPGDSLPDGTNLMDVYVVGSGDGGATWGPPVLITEERGLEDSDASLARRVDDNLHIVYFSDPQFGNNTASGAPPYRTNIMYYAFAKANIPLTSTGVADRDPSAIPASFALHQNYPNPFNPSTTITFELPLTTRVTLSIFDVTGKRVATLVNGTMPAGKHSVVWDAAKKMASGVYVAQLEGQGISARMKMTLMK
ncbi:T9SS type A sorting domain-containing protein [candidate division KSB1 bacterium]|nr:T9SS type A sorting domain-containing protein [candidate division KSB1 bacterium]